MTLAKGLQQIAACARAGEIHSDRKLTAIDFTLRRRRLNTQLLRDIADSENEVRLRLVRRPENRFGNDFEFSGDSVARHGDKPFDRMASAGQPSERKHSREFVGNVGARSRQPS